MNRIQTEMEKWDKLYELEYLVEFDEGNFEIVTQEKDNIIQAMSR